MTAIAMSAGTAKAVAGATPASAGRQASPIISAIDHITSNQEARHSDIYAAGAQIRLMNQREEQGLCVSCGGQQYQCECFPEGDY